MIVSDGESDDSAGYLLLLKFRGWKLHLLHSATNALSALIVDKLSGLMRRYGLQRRHHRRPRCDTVIDNKAGKGGDCQNHLSMHSAKPLLIDRKGGSAEPPGGLAGGRSIDATAICQVPTGILLTKPEPRLGWQS